MRARDLLSILKQVANNSALRRQLLYAIGRILVHPVERHWPNGPSLAPRSLQIMVTDICNLRCRMCQYAYSRSRDFRLNRFGRMAMEVWRSIIDTAPGRPIISITGGEPLLHEDLPDFILYAKQRGHYCTLTTNGWMLAERAEALCNSRLDLIVISIDGDEESHDRIRSKGSYQRALAGIRRIMEQCPRPLVGISMAVSDLSQRAIEKGYSTATELGVDVFNIQHLWMHTDQMVIGQDSHPNLAATARVDWDVEVKDIKPYIVWDGIQSVRRKSKGPALNVYPQLARKEMHLYYECPERLVRVCNTRCAWLTMKIWPNGDVGICREHLAGNVRDAPLRDIWNNARYRSFRRYLAQKGTCPICPRCCLLFSRY